MQVRNDWNALGAERLDIATTAKSPEEWQKRWKDTSAAFPFKWGSCWTATMTYQVEDYAAEIGFFVDGLGFKCNAISPDFTMLAAPDRSYFFCVVPVPEGGRATPSDTFHLSFMLDDIDASTEAIDARGIAFDERPAPWGEGAPMKKGSLRTPNGVRVECWGLVSSPAETAT